MRSVTVLVAGPGTTQLLGVSTSVTWVAGRAVALMLPTSSKELRADSSPAWTASLPFSEEKMPAERTV